MAKVNKMMPPRNTTIRGQDHLLAYITPEEAQLLMDNGGTGEAGPMGIPAFAEDDGDDDVGGSVGGGIGGDDVGTAGGPSGGDFGGGGNDGGMSQSEIDAAINDAMADLGPNVSEYGIATDDFGSNLFGGDYYPSGTEYGQPNYKAVTDVWNQINKAKQYEQPLGASIMSLFNPFASIPKVQSLATQFMGPRYIDALAKVGNTPIYSNGRVTGVADKYGNVIEGTDPNAPDAGGRDDGPPEKVPEDLLTGCPEGYVKDEQLGGFCRLDTGTTAASAPTVTAPTTGGYAQMGQLDIAPTGLPQFQQQYGAGFGSPSQFAAANTDFRRRGAVMPAYPGYTLLS